VIDNHPRPFNVLVPTNAEERKEYTDKIVIAPGFEKRAGVMFWGFHGLLPDRWVKLS